MWTEGLLLALGVLQLYPAIKGHRWNYHNEGAWGGLCASGEEQSPINVVSRDAVLVERPRLQLDGYTNLTMLAVNNGHTVQLSANMRIKPTLHGGILGETKYVLEQFHFHWIGEHSIDNYKYPIEMHLVHRRSDIETLEKARQVVSGIAVITIMFQVTTDRSKGHALKDIMDVLPHLVYSSSNARSTRPLNVLKILGNNIDSYYYYSGSLTTPNCTEGVHWIIRDSPLPVTDFQYRKMSAVQVGGVSNFRPVQPLRRRTVYRVVTESTSKTSEEPVAAGFKANVVTRLRNIINFLFH